VSGVAEQAVIVLGRSVELQPDRASPHYWLGMALSATGDPAGAKRELTAALAAGDFAGKNDAQAELVRLNAD
jgi:Flp pilus assembly protein TadD